MYFSCRNGNKYILNPSVWCLTFITFLSASARGLLRNTGFRMYSLHSNILCVIERGLKSLPSHNKRNALMFHAGFIILYHLTYLQDCSQHPKATGLSVLKNNIYKYIYILYSPFKLRDLRYSQWSSCGFTLSGTWGYVFELWSVDTASHSRRRYHILEACYWNWET
jgi:hypothetical protein